MADMLKDGLAWLTGQLREHASQAVLYRRTTGPTPIELEVQAIFGAKLLRLNDVDGGVRLEWTDLDFCIPAADLAVDGVPLIPTRGDTIVITTAYDEQIFEVFPMGDEAPWRWSDPHQSMYRIHTKHIDTESAY